MWIYEKAESGITVFNEVASESNVNGQLVLLPIFLEGHCAGWGLEGTSVSKY